MKILVVEQSKIVRDSLFKLLQKNGYEVFCAASGHDAIDILDNFKINMCIINPHLPANNGLELLYEMNSYEDLKRVPKILITDEHTYFNRHLDQLESLGVVAIEPRSRLTEASLLQMCISGNLHAKTS